jgi:hypothetical protein
MKVALLLSSIVGLLMPSQLQAQTLAEREPDMTIDLSKPPAMPGFFAIPYVFQSSGLDCPDNERWTMTISSGLLKFYHFNPPIGQPQQSALVTHLKNDPTDDFTYRLQYLRPNCRVDIDIQQQVHADGEWKPLLVTKERRPSLSEEERQEVVRRRLAPLELPKNPGPITQADIDKLNKMFKPKGRPRWNASTFSWGIVFDDPPRPCMEVLGEIMIIKNSFTMAFFAPLSGELNKFVMGGSDLDESHARIYLTKDDCRVEFTISESAISDGKSVPIPLNVLPDEPQPDMFTLKP